MIVQTVRFFQVNLILLRYGLTDLLLKVSPPWFVRLPLYLLVFLVRGWRRDKKVLAVRIRMALEKSGTIFVKFGQTLSTRRDLLPRDVADELAKLQDKVPSFSSAQAKTIIAEALDEPLEEVFLSFNDKPLAAASVAQVHEAVMEVDGENQDVVVKVLRPGIKRQIHHDIALLYLLAKLFGWIKPAESRRLRLLEVIEEYQKTILGELDLMREAANASQLRRNFEGSSRLYVPKVYWRYCRREVMVMERIRGVSISDTARLNQERVDLKELSERGVEIFFTQVFEHNFFHADMHPGNLFIDTSDPLRPQYQGVDFGIMGTLSIEDQRYLAENFLAFFHSDYRRVAELHIESGWVPADTRMDELESAIRTVCEPIFQRPLNEVSFGQLLVRLFQIARRFDMRVQPQLILLQKTLLNIEGLGRELYPDLDLWETAKPFLERWVSRRSGPAFIFSELQQRLPAVLVQLPALPEMLASHLERARTAQQQIEKDHIELRRTIQRAQRNLIIALFFLAAVTAAAFLVR